MLQLMFVVISRSLWLVIVAWMQLVRALVNWHRNMCWRLIMWTVNILTFPLRVLFALQREKMMKRLLQDMQLELEDLAWDNKKLQAHLQVALKEHHFLESMLSEIEEDHDKAILKIELLEREVHRLRDQNLRLREIQTKGHWDPMFKSDTEDEPTTEPPPWQSTKTSLNDQKPTAELNPTGLFDPLTPLVFSPDVDIDAALDQRRQIAFSQSLFSATLSLVVGAIIWAAEDPCLPLVVALFTVVGLSLRSVVRFFSTIRNRPASDAVALLSFNWFILGTLACPTFPRVARFIFAGFQGHFGPDL